MTSSASWSTTATGTATAFRSVPVTSHSPAPVRPTRRVVVVQPNDGLPSLPSKPPPPAESVSACYSWAALDPCRAFAWRSPHMSVMRLIVVHPYSEFEVRRAFRSEARLIFGHGVNRPADLDLWNLYGVTGHPCRGLLPTNFQLPRPFHSRLMVKRGTYGLFQTVPV